MKNCFYNSKVSDFVETPISTIISVLEDNHKLFNNDNDITKQRNAWKSSLTYLQKILNEVICKEIEVILEYNLPFSGERIDAILIGKNKEQKLEAIVIEFKGWTFANYQSDTYVESDLGKSTHPNYQLSSYLGKLIYSHSASDKFDFYGVVSMYNMENTRSNLKFDNEIILKSEEAKFAAFINDHLSNPPNSDEVNNLLNGTYTHNKKLFNVIQENADSLINSTYKALAVVGFGLSDEQINLISEIEADVLAGNSMTYLIQGSPGSGKTLIAVNLLLSSLRREIKTVLALKNNRLVECLRNVFNTVKDKYGRTIYTNSVIKYYSTGRGDPGIAQNNFAGATFDLVIYDEAQRMDGENIRNSFKRGKVNVIFFDEFQRLNYNEKGSLINFEKLAVEEKINLKKRFLKGVYRIEGGEVYHQWLEKFVENPANMKKTSEWSTNYDLRMFKDFDVLYKKLNELRSHHFKVALIASFTESTGNFNTTSNANIRIGPGLISNLDNYRNSLNNIYWLMNTSEYVEFWVDGKCNELEKCASIYGCQGFEADYIGFVWGRDFVIRDEIWVLGTNCEDYPSVAGNYPLKNLFSLSQNGNTEIAAATMQLMKNRLRIFLSRGIKGTYIYCEDNETREFLINNLQSKTN